MHVLFIHQAFPAQFGRLALELSKRYGWKCSFLIQDFSSCPTPTPEMLEHLELRRIPVSAEFRAAPPAPWPQIYGRFLELSQAVYDGVRGWPDLRPDLVVANGGHGAPTVFLREALDCPIVVYCEYFFAPSHSDLSYRIDLPPAEPAPFFPRSINATTLESLVECDVGYSPTHWQRQSFPERFRYKIGVHFDGIDTELYRPREVPRVIAGRSISPETHIVTYVARGLESVRGFDLFMKVAQRIARERSDVLFVVLGGEQIHYGWDTLHTGSPSFKQWVLRQSDYDLSRFLFLGLTPPEQLADVLCLSDLHVYLSVPFVLSWSVINAMACGCVVLGSDVPPVRELIQPDVNGLIEPLFDVAEIAETALRVLDDPAAFRPLGQAARTIVQEKYSLDVAVPALKDFFEQTASTVRRT